MIGQPQLAARARGLLARMTGRCRLIKIVVGELDEETHITPMTEVTLWEGPCLIRPADRESRRVENAGETITIGLYTGWLPMEAGDFLADAERLIVFHPLSLRLTILDAPPDMWPIGRRIVCQRAT